MNPGVELVSDLGCTSNGGDGPGRWPDGRDSEESAEILDSKILVVDDSRTTRLLIRGCLNRAGFANVSLAEDGGQALSAITESLPDLLIVDIEMPVVDGLQLCRQLREQPRTQSLPILIQSAHGLGETVAWAFQAGANDLVPKPIEPLELLARVRVLLENQILLRRLRDFHARVAKELEIARGMQRSLCPFPQTLDSLERSYGVSIDWHFSPSSELGGDMWYAVPINEHSFALLLADFSGHGVAASMNTFRLHAWLSEQVVDPSNPAGLLAGLNDYLCSSLPLGEFATVFLACVDTRSSRITYSTAGSPPPLVWSAGSNRGPEFVDSAGLPLGLKAGWSYRNLTIPFNPDDCALLYSDALIESSDRHGGCLGEEGLRGLVESTNLEGDPKSQFERILGRFLSGIEPPLSDDLTMVMVRRCAR